MISEYTPEERESGSGIDASGQWVLIEDVRPRNREDFWRGFLIALLVVSLYVIALSVTMKS